MVLSSLSKSFQLLTKAEKLTVLHRCVITPRDEGRKQFIRQEWKQAQLSLDSEGNFSEEFFSNIFLKRDPLKAATL